MRRAIAFTAASVLAARAGYRRLVAGDLTVDLDIGRSTRALGPISVTIDAPRAVVWEVMTAPYVGRVPGDLKDEITVVERGTDMVLAAHRTRVGPDLVATTLETVRFDEPRAVHFRLVRGPVPFVTERFTLAELGDSTRLDYDGQMGTDLWAAGRWWATVVGTRWEAAVRASMAGIREHAEERAAHQRARR